MKLFYSSTCAALFCAASLLNPVVALPADQPTEQRNQTGTIDPSVIIKNFLTGSCNETTSCTIPEENVRRYFFTSCFEADSNITTAAICTKVLSGEPKDIGCFLSDGKTGLERDDLYNNTILCNMTLTDTHNNVSGIELPRETSH